MEKLRNIQISNLKSIVAYLIAGCKNIAALVELAHTDGYELFLVGGFLRDALLGKRCKDVDFVSGNAHALSRSVAKETGSKFVAIDRKFGTLRLVPPADSDEPGELFVVDLSPLRGSNILDDLYQRDFTVNALALDLSTWWTRREAHLFDPLGGITDLETGRLHLCSQLSLANDPLRILRAYRLALVYGLTLTAQTRKSIRQAVHRLNQVPVERIRDEMMLILSKANSVSILRVLDEDGVFELLLPECADMRNLHYNNSQNFDLWQHSLGTLEALEFFLNNIHKLFGDYTDEASIILNQKLAGERRRQTSLKLSALLHDIGIQYCTFPPKNDNIRFQGHEVAGGELAASLCSRLRLSNKEINFVGHLVRNHMRTVRLFRHTHTPRRPLCRFFRLGPELFWPLLLLLASDYKASQGFVSAGGDQQPLQQRIRDWLDFYYKELKPRELEPPLVSGHNLMKQLNLSPGPTVGRLLNALAELRWEGCIGTQQQALEHAKELLELWGKRESA